MSDRWRRLLIAASIIGALSIIVWTLPRLPFVQNQIQSLIQQRAKEASIDLSYDRLKIGLLPPAVTLYGVEVKHQQFGEFAADAVTVSVRPWADSQNRIVIREIYLERPQVKAELENLLAQPRLQSSDKSTDKNNKVKVAIWGWRIDDGSVGITNQAGESLDVKDLSFRLGQRFYGDTRVEAKIGSVNLKSNKLDDPLIFSVTTEILSDDAGFSQGLKATKLRAETKDGDYLDFSGSVSLSGDRVQFGDQVTLRGALDIERLLLALGKHPEFAGASSFSIHPKADCTDGFLGLCVEGSARVKNFYAQGRRMGDLSTDIELVERVSLKNIVLSDPSLGSITGAASFPLAPQPDINLNLQANNAQLGEVLSRIGIEGPWVNGRCNGSIKGKMGTSNPTSGYLKLQISTTDFVVYDKSFDKNPSFNLLKLPQLDATGELKFDKGVLTVADTEFESQGMTMNVGGNIGLRQSSVHLKAISERVDLLKLGPIGAVPLSGKGPLRLKIDIEKSVAITGYGSLDQFGISGSILGDLSTNINVIEDRLRLEDSVLIQGTGLATGEVELDFGGSRISGLLNARDLDAYSVASNFAIPVDYLAPSQTELDGIIEVEGPFDEIDIRAIDFRGPVAVRNSKAGRIKLNAEFDLGATDPSLADLDIQWVRGSGAAKFDVEVSQELHQEQRYRFGVAMRGFPLEPIDRLLTEAPIASGIITGTTLLQGELETLAGPLDAVIEDFHFLDLNFGRLSLSGSTTDSKLIAEAYAKAMRADINAEFDLVEPYAYLIEGESDSIDLGSAYPIPESVSGNVAAKTMVRGQLIEPTQEFMTVRVSRGDLVVLNENLSLSGPANIIYKDDAFRLVDLNFANQRLSVQADGILAYGKPVSNLNLKLSSPLEVWNASVPSIELQGGILSADVKILGDFMRPQYEGLVAVNRATIASEYLDAPLTGVRMQAKLLEDRVELRDGNGTVGRGQIRFSGEIRSAFSEQPQLSVRALLNDVGVLPMQDTKLRAEGQIEANGPINDLNVTGNIGVSGFEYNRQVAIDWLELLPGTATPLEVPNFVEGQNTKMDIRIYTLSEGRIDVGDLEATFDTDLRIVGTSNQFGLVGSLVPRDAKIQYRDLDLLLEPGGMITFRQPYTIQADFDLTVAGQACEMDVWIDLQGSNAEPALNFRGQDDNGTVTQEDVFFCINTGRRLETLSTGDDNTDRNNALETGVDLFWQLSGLGDRVKNVIPYFDDVRLTSGLSGAGAEVRNSVRLVLSKDVGPNLKLRYNGALDTVNDHEVSLQYGFGEQMRLEGNRNSQSDRSDNVSVGDLGLDLKLQWDFD